MLSEIPQIWEAAQRHGLKMAANFLRKHSFLIRRIATPKPGDALLTINSPGTRDTVNTGRFRSRENALVFDGHVAPPD